jgi:DNA-binding transcriptional MerR regulator
MQTITLEQTARILDKFNICFTEGAVKSMVERQTLRAIPKNSEDTRYSKYTFVIDAKSLVKMLQDKGYSIEDIKDALSHWIEL